MVCLSVGIALPIGMPSWVTRMPTPGNSTYYYRVTKAEGKTYEEAYSKAFSMAILESSWKMGVTVNADDNAQTLEESIRKSINVQNDAMVLPLNKACEYETKVGNKITLYILWQVSSDARYDAKFDNINNCE